MKGTVKLLRADKGFGFIKGETAVDYFFHASAIVGEGIDMLREGDSVEFNVGEDRSSGARSRRPLASLTISSSRHTWHR